MWNALPVELQDLIVTKTGEVQMKTHCIVFEDKVRDNDTVRVKEFAKTETMAKVDGASWGRVCACNNLPLDIEEISSPVHFGDVYEDSFDESWGDHFELMLARTPDARLWADDGRSGWSHIGVCGVFVVHRYPRACRLTRRYAQTIAVCDALLFKHVQIAGDVDNTAEALGMERVPAVVMHVDD